MTFAEVKRAIESRIRVERKQEKIMATYDYILANLICVGVQATLNGGEGIPDINEVYSGLFNDEVKAREDKIISVKDELSALRLKQFAKSHNKKFEK